MNLKNPTPLPINYIECNFVMGWKDGTMATVDEINQIKRAFREESGPMLLPLQMPATQKRTGAELCCTNVAQILATVAQKTLHLIMFPKKRSMRGKNQFPYIFVTIDVKNHGSRRRLLIRPLPWMENHRIKNYHPTFLALNLETSNSRSICLQCWTNLRSHEKKYACSAGRCEVNKILFFWKTAFLHLSKWTLRGIVRDDLKYFSP